MPEYELNDEAESLSVMTSTNIEVTLKKKINKIWCNNRHVECKDDWKFKIHEDNLITNHSSFFAS